MNFDFQTEFLSIDFDDILLQGNHSMLNSYEHYIQFKNKYFTEALDNYGQFQQLQNYFISLHQSLDNTESKVTFVYVDKQVLQDVQQQMNNLILKQRRLLNNMKHYLITLNTIQIDSKDDTASIKSTASKSKRRTRFFGKLL